MSLNGITMMIIIIIIILLLFTRVQIGLMMKAQTCRETFVCPSFVGKCVCGLVLLLLLDIVYSVSP